METTPATFATVLFGFGYPRTRDEYFSMFRKEKYHILFTSSGDELLRLYHDHTEVSLVIMTTEMGEFSGFEILHQMKNDRSGIPVILLSASISLESLKLASMYRCNEFLQLPLQKNEFLMMINKYLH